MAFYEGLPLVEHRIMLDYSFLKRVVASAGLELEKEGVDVLGSCWKFMSEEE